MRGNATATAWLQRGLLAVLGTTLVVVGLQATGNAVATVNVSDGTVWLVNPPTGTVVQVSSASEQVTAVVKVADQGTPLTGAQDGHSAVVLNRATGELGRVDGVGLSYGHQTTFAGSSPADLQLFAGPGGAYVLDAAQGWVRTLNPADLTTVREASLTTGAKVAEVDDEGNLWALDQGAGQVSRVTPTGEVTSTDAGGVGASLTLVKDRPYVVEPANDRVVALDADDAEIDRDHCLGGGEGESVLAAGSGRRDPRRLVATLLPDSGELLTTDVGSGRCTTLSVSADTPQSGGTPAPSTSAPYGEPVLSGDLLYIPVVSRGEVLVIDTAENRLVRTIDSDELFAAAGEATTAGLSAGRNFELVLDDGNVWFNNLSGPEAGILDRDGVALRVLKYETEVLGKRVGAGDGLGVSDDPSGLQVDVDPSGGDVASDRKARDGGAGEGEGEGEGESGAGGDGGTGTEGEGAGEGGLNLGTSGPLGLGQAAALTLLPPGAPSDVVRDSNPGAPLPDVALNPVESRGSGIQSSQAPAPAQQPAPSPGGNPAPRPADPTKLQANFNFGPAVVQAGKPVSFVDRSTGSPAPSSWLWDFGDGSNERANNPTHTYKTAGTYVVTLTVGNGRETSRSQPVQIAVAGPDKPPVANFTFEPRTGIEVGQPVQFRDASVGDPPAVEWSWNWGDGTRSTGANVSHTWNQANSYQVTLTVRNQYGSASAVKTIDVGNKTAIPKASFTYNPQKVVAGDPVTFIDTSSDGPSGWAWDFGDGGIASSRAVVHRFAEPGTYTVRLVARNSRGASEPVTQQVAVTAPTERPRARIRATDNEVAVGEKVVFTSTSLGSPTSVRWDFGDGTGADGSPVDHAWGQPGTYRVWLRVENEAGSDTAGPLEVVVTKPNRLVANFSHRPGAQPNDPVAPGRPVEFRDESTGAVTSREWDFGDGSRGSGASASHAYARAGTYKASLRVSDGTSSSTITRDVFVAGPAVEPPKAEFAFSPAKPVVGQAVSFADRSTNAASWSWDFGDGSSDRSQNPSHAYASKGTYTVTLTVANGSGGSSTRTQSVTVDAEPKAAPRPEFSVSPDDASQRTVGRTLTFTDQTRGAMSTPQFTFPSPIGTVSPPPGNRAVQVAFDRAGTIEVTMKVCWADDASNCGSTSQAITIRPAVAPPKAEFTVAPLISPKVAQIKTQVTFSNTSPAEGTTVEWLIGGQRSTGDTASFQATNPGEVSVTMTVTNSAGSSTAKDVIRFIDAAAPAAKFSGPAKVAVGTPVQFTDQSTGLVSGYTWDFGDGTTSTAASPTHTYTRAGRYTVKLTVANDFGSNATTGEIEVESSAQAAPSIEVTPIADPNQRTGTGNGAGGGGGGVRVGQAVRLADSSTGGGVETWEWDFGDGNKGSGKMVSHTWARAGSYTVRLVVTGPFGSIPTTITIVVS